MSMIMFIKNHFHNYITFKTKIQLNSINQQDLEELFFLAEEFSDINNRNQAIS